MNNKTNQQFQLDDFILLDKVGEGQFGRVFRIKLKSTNQIYAAKISKERLDNDSDKFFLNISREVNIISKLNHPTILKFIFYSAINFKKKPKPVIITEFVSNGSLDKLIVQEKNSITNYLNDTLKLIIIYGIASAMSYLHFHDIIHRDLKPANILLDDLFHPKLADFGLSKMINSQNKSVSGITGTPIYMAPEILESANYLKASDVYSFAMIVYEIITFENPFENLHFFNLLSLVTKGHRPEIKNSINNSYRDLIQRCWNQEPSKRPTFDQILEQLKTDRSFITEKVNQNDYFNYIEFIDEYKDSFNSEKNAFYIDKFINNKPSYLLSFKGNDHSKELKFENYFYKDLINQEEDCKLLIKEADNSLKRYYIGRCLIEGRDNFICNTQLGLKFLKLAIKEKCIESVIYYCKLLIKGSIIPRNLEKVKKLLKIHIEENDAIYLLLMGKIMKYENKNYEAKSFFLKSLEKGSIEAMHELGKLMLKRFVNKEETMLYFKKAADNHYLPSAYKYGLLLMKENINEGMKYIKYAADNDYLKAIYEYYLIIKNKDESIKYLEKAAHKGHIEAMNRYAHYLYENQTNNKWLEESRKLFKKSADKGNIDSIYRYGVILYNEQGLSSDKINSAKYIKIAANNGHSSAMSRYGAMLHTGQGVEMDKIEAIKYYKKGIDHGNNYAMYNYAYMLDNGDCVEENKEEAIKYYKMAAEQGNEHAYYALGYKYDYGEGFKVNKEEAIRYYKLAIKYGHKNAMVRYGEMMMNGIGAEINKEKAINYFQMAINKGCTNAMYHYALILKNEDCVEAIKYFKMAADKGNSDAMYHYASILYKGDGVETNIEEALVYYKMAIEKGHQNAINDYNIISKKLINEKDIKNDSISIVKNEPHNHNDPNERSKIVFAPVTISMMSKLKNTRKIESPQLGPNQLNHITPKIMATVIAPSKKYPVNFNSVRHNNKSSTQFSTQYTDINSEIEYTFYFTGGDRNMLLNGIQVKLIPSMNKKQCEVALLKSLENKLDMANKQLLLYLAGGIQFNHGTIGDIFMNNWKVRNVIYGVITRRVSNEVLEKSFSELCDARTYENKILLSPLVDSTKRGLSDIACLLGYLNHDGCNSDLLLRSLAAVIHFPPLIASINRIIDRNNVVGRDIVCVTSTLYTYFKSYLVPNIFSTYVFEFSLHICNIIVNIDEIPDDIPLKKIVTKSNEFFSSLKQKPIVYFWTGDTGDDLEWYDYEFSFDLIKNSYYNLRKFTPISPLSVRTANGCSIVQGNEYEFLYLMQSPSKKYQSQNFIEIIDPIKGQTNSVDVESFAQSQKYKMIDYSIEPENVKQIILFNFCESNTMFNDFEGNKIPHGCNNYHRITIAYQYITAFVNKLYGYHIPSIQGYVSINNDITLKCPLSPQFIDLENILNKNISPCFEFKIWDSLMLSCNEIVKFRRDYNGKERYKNAISRILVITDCEDNSSSFKVNDVVSELISNHIIVDSIIINKEDKCKMLCTVCHATGGLSFCFKSVEHGLSIIEQSAFINYEERKKISVDNIHSSYLITEDFVKNAKFDENVEREESIIGKNNINFATPLYIISKNVDSLIPNQRLKRILKELLLANEITNSNSKFYDEDLKVLACCDKVDVWMVFIKGCEGTPYENKWWFLLVTFPDQYPYQSPKLRFVSVPYHLNISSDGIICHNIIEKGYLPSKHVVHIIQEIKELFLLPNPNTPVHITIFDIYRQDKIKYYQLCKESSLKNAKDDYNDFIKSYNIVVNNEHIHKRIPFNEQSMDMSLHMISQISGKPIHKDKLIKASTGVYYDRDELKQLISSSKKPICVITGKLFLEKLDDIKIHTY